MVTKQKELEALESVLLLLSLMIMHARLLSILIRGVEQQVLVSHHDDDLNRLQCYFL